MGPSCSKSILSINPSLFRPTPQLSLSQYGILWGKLAHFPLASSVGSWVIVLSPLLRVDTYFSSITFRIPKPKKLFAYLTHFFLLSCLFSLSLWISTFQTFLYRHFCGSEEEQKINSTGQSSVYNEMLPIQLDGVCLPIFGSSVHFTVPAWRRCSKRSYHQGGSCEDKCIL